MARMSKADRRKERVSDLKLMVFATIAVLICMVMMLVWMHMTQEVKGQLEKLQGGGGSSDEVSEEGRKKILRQRIVSKRAAAETHLHATLDAQREVDRSDTRTASTCHPLSSWQSERVPCKYTAPTGSRPNLVIVTEHFGPPKDFLVPHYDSLGTWLISLQEPTLWNVLVNASDSLRKLYCAEPWLELTHNFDPIGSVDTKLVTALDTQKKDIDLHALLKDATFRQGLIVGVTQNVAAFTDSSLEQPDKRLQHIFSKGMEYALDHLLPRGVAEWKVSDIETIHRHVCEGEPDVETVGQFRRETVHVGYGFLMPPPLGFELGYLMEVYLAWLKMAADDECSHPVLLAGQAFSLLHRMQPFTDCNTRVAKVMLNAVLMQHGYAPLHMFLGASKSKLKDMQGAYYEGKPNDLLDHLATQVQEMMSRISNGDIQKYATHALMD